MIDSDTRLRAARGIAKTETEASREVFATLKRRGHPEAPPPTLSDGWGGIDEAMVAVYGTGAGIYRGGTPADQKASPTGLAVSANGQAAQKGTRDWHQITGHIRS